MYLRKIPKLFCIDIFSKIIYTPKMIDPTITDTLPVKAQFRLINKAQCKKFALEFAKANRGHKFTRVGSDFLISCEATLRNHIQSRVKSHPSVGKTLM